MNISLLNRLNDKTLQIVLGSYLLLDSEFTIIEISERFLSEFGEEYSALIGVSLPSIISKNHENIINKGKKTVFLYFFEKSLPLNIEIISFDDRSNKVFLAKFENLTELAFYKNQNFRWEQRYKLMLDEKNQLFFNQENGNDIRWGEQIKDVLGEVFNKNSLFEDVFPYVHKSFRNDFIRKFENVLESENKFDFEFLFNYNEKTEWRRIIAQRSSINDKQFLFGVIENVHRKKIEEIQNERDIDSFKRLLHDINEVFYKTNADGEIILISKAVERVLKYDADSLISKHVEVLYFDTNDRKNLIESLYKDGSVENYEMKLKNSSGKAVFVSLNARFYYGADGKLQGTEGMFFDITEKRKVEHERIKLLNEFKNSLSGVNIQLFRLGRSLNDDFIILFNEGKLAKKQLNYSEKKVENIYGRKLEDNEVKCFNKGFEGQTNSIINIVNDKYLKTTISPFKRSSNKLVEEIIGVVYDITETTKTNRQLAESEEKYKTFVEEANDGIIIIQDGKFVFVNKSFVKMTNYNSAVEIVGKDIKGFVGGNQHEIIAENHKKRMQNRKTVPQIYEILVKRSDGGVFPAELNNSVINYNNRAAGLTFVRDLTEKKKDEAKLLENIKRNKILLESFPLLYIVINAKTEILNFNNPKESDLKEFDKVLLNAKTINELGFLNDYIENIAKSIKNCIEGKTIENIEIHYVFDNQEKYLHLNFVKLGENEVLLTFDNVTERYIYEAKLISEKERAEQSDRLKSAFLANMSHEIRTPMNAIIGFSEMLKYPDISSGERDEFVNIINYRSKDLLNLINDIIDVSKIEAGIFSFQIKKESLIEIVQEVFDSFKSEEKIINNQIEYNLNYFVNPENIQISTDKGKLKQLLSNLLNNAIKFTKKGKVEMRVFNKGGSIFFDVIDTGIGIEEINKNKIFDRFIQVEMGADRPFEGAGIGLTICKAIVDVFNGKIDLKSKIGKGSMFRVELPINTNK